jgi:C4-dicarboxylate transporter DctQ subunit
MVFRILSRTVEAAVVAISTVIVGVVVVEVGLRYLFSSSLIFTEELARYLMVWVVFLGSAIAVRDGAHIRISMLLNRLPPSVQRWVTVIAEVLTLVFLSIIVVEGVRILPKQLSQIPATFDVPLFYFYLAIPVGSLLMMIFLLPRLWQGLRSGDDGDLEERRQNKC